MLTHMIIGATPPCDELCNSLVKVKATEAGASTLSYLLVNSTTDINNSAIGGASTKIEHKHSFIRIISICCC